jgi:uncharacterized SAM-binding protein YcdF (DUF218 family)
MSTVTLAFLKTLLLPPGLCVVIAGLALGLRGKQRLSMFLLCLAVSLLYVCSTPLASRALAGLLEQRYPPLAPGAPLAPDVGAIVVLGCDRYANAPEYGQDEVSACTLARLRYAADLQARSGLPVLLSGGRPMGEPQSEAQLMDRVMAERFGVKARWLEQDSRDTAGNAADSAMLLRAANIQRVALVTHAMHMPRAMRSFRRQGLEPVAAPTQFYSVTDRRPAWFAVLPSGGSLLVSGMAMYEMLGLAWYSLTGK